MYIVMYVNTNAQKRDAIPVGPRGGVPFLGTQAEHTQHTNHTAKSNIHASPVCLIEVCCTSSVCLLPGKVLIECTSQRNPTRS